MVDILLTSGRLLLIYKSISMSIIDLYIMNATPIISEIIQAARQKGMSQKTLAERADITPETLSRLKTCGGNPTFDILQRLAKAVDMSFVLSPAAVASQPMDKAVAFRRRHKTLVWSNPSAGDATYLQRALLRPQFTVLLDAAVQYGLARLESEWAALRAQGSAEVEQATPITENILKNIRHGYEQAAA